MNVGFTGTRKGMSEAQKSQLHRVLALLQYAAQVSNQSVRVFHGGALGADDEAHYIADRLGMDPNPVLVMSEDSPGRSYLARNRVIVSRAELLIAAPETDTEQLRSGTWATVRYARQAGKPVIMLSRGTK